VGGSDFKNDRYNLIKTVQMKNISIFIIFLNLSLYSFSQSDFDKTKGKIDAYLRTNNTRFFR